MKPRKVLLVTSSFPPGIGGMQSYYYNLAKHTKHEIVVVAPEYPDHPDTPQFDRTQPYRTIRGSYIKGERADLGSWGRLYRLIRRTIKGEEPDVTVYGLVLIGFAGLLFSLFGSRRYMIAAHGMELLLFRRIPLLNLIVRAILRRADGVIVNSGYTKRIVQQFGVDAGRISIVYPGVDPQFDRQQASAALRGELGLDGKYVLLSVGRLVTRKGHDKVIEALPDILRQMPHAVYLIVGEGPQRERLELLAQSLNVDHVVRFVGSVRGIDRLNEYYSLADQFIMVSREMDNDVEGFGIVYMEAASAGVPIIAGRSGGAAEAVLDGATGLLVNPEAASEIAESVVRLAGDASLRERLVRTGYRRAKQQFQHAKVAEAFDVQIGRVCARPSRRKRRAEEPAISRIRP